MVGKLSGGQKQRLAVATALVGNPKILFLDEPTTGLDPQSRRQLWEIIRQFQQNRGTVLLTTHYMDEAERLCDRLAIIDQGKIIAEGTPAELIARLSGHHVVEFAINGGNGVRRRVVGALAGRAIRPTRRRILLLAGRRATPHHSCPVVGGAAARCATRSSHHAAGQPGRCICGSHRSPPEGGVMALPEIQVEPPDVTRPHAR